MQHLAKEDWVLVAVVTFLLVMFCALVAHGQQTPNPASPAVQPGELLGEIVIDGVALTPQEHEDYTRVVAAKATTLRQTRAFVEQVIQWIDTVGGQLAADQAQAARILVMRQDFLDLGKRAIEQIASTPVSGRTIRTRTLELNLEKAEAELAQAEEAVASVNEGEEHNEARAAAQAKRDERKADRDAAQQALDDWNAGAQP